MASSGATVVGLVGVELAPLRRCLERGKQGMVLCKEVRMDTQTLTNVINDLTRVRDVCSSQLDIGALKELDRAIAGLRQLRDEPQNTAEAEGLKLRVLQAVAAVVSITTNVRDWL